MTEYFTDLMLFMLIYLCSILERGFVTPGCGSRSIQYQCFEAKLPYVLRCLVDCDINGANWLELPAGTYSVRPSNGSDSELGLSTKTHTQ
jgi:DNA polymerase delta subunit 1